MFRSFLVGNLLVWLSRIQHLTIILIIFVFLGSSIGVIYSAHLTRQMYAELQTLQSDQDDLDSEYEKLLLEQSAWADYTRVDQLAREELAMTIPSRQNLIVVKQRAIAAGSASNGLKMNGSVVVNLVNKVPASHLENELAFEAANP